MTGLVVLLAAGLGILWASGVAYVAWMLTHPPRRTYAAAVARGLPGSPGELDHPREFTSWSFASRGRRLPAWMFRGDLPSTGGPTIILTHGWGDSRIGALARVRALAPVASWIIAWDLPGHGEAPGWCSLGLAELTDLDGLLRDIQPHLLEHQSRMVLYGWSLGAGLSIAAAVEHPEIAAVIAESPYRLPATPARNVLRARGLPWRSVLSPAMRTVGSLYRNPRFAGFDRASLAARVRCPLLTLHGECDIVSPIQDGRDVAASAPHGSLVIIPDAGHNDLWTDAGLAAASTAAVQGFLRGLSPTLTP